MYINLLLYVREGRVVLYNTKITVFSEQCSTTPAQVFKKKITSTCLYLKMFWPLLILIFQQITARIGENKFSHPFFEEEGKVSTIFE